MIDGEIWGHPKLSIFVHRSKDFSSERSFRQIEKLKNNPPPKKSHVFDVGIKRGAEDLQPLSPCVYWNQVRQNFFKSNLKQLENSGFIGVADGIDILIYSVSQASPAQMTVCSNVPSYREMMMMTHFLS